MAGQAYGISIQNNSSIDDKNAIVFQQSPGLPAEGFSLAWLTKMCHKGTSVHFDWTVDYNFVWGQNGTLKPGTDYMAGQAIDADLTANNKVALLYYDGGYKFGPVSQSAATGSLIVTQSLDIPGYDNPEQGSVGIGMSGRGTFVVPTQPNGDGGGTQFSITPVYWVGFGSHAPGIVVTEDILDFPHELTFPVGSFNAVCVLDSGGWNVKYE